MVGAVLALVFISHVVVELAGWRLLQPAADESLRVVEAFRQRGEPVDVALLGSSRMRRAVTVMVLEEELAATTGREVTAFNFGLQAGTVPAFHIVARDVLRDRLAPRLLVVGLGVRALNGNNPRYVRTIRHMVAPLDLLGPLGPRLTEPPELGAALLALFRAPGTLMQAWRLGGEVEGEVAALLARGGSMYEPAVDSPPADRDRVLRELSERTQKRARRTREKLLVDFDVEGRSRWALEQLFELARLRGIEVVVVNLPVTAPFAAAAYQDEQYEQYLTVIRSVCSDAYVPWLDANSPELRPARFMFHDGDHLNAAGATSFSRWLAGEIARYLPATER